MIFRKHIEKLFLSVSLIAGVWSQDVSGECRECDDCYPVVALKSNLLHDLLLTPDLGVEVSLANRYSVSAEGVYAWWSNDARHRYWRVRGGWLEMRYWFDNRRGALTGQHLGVYGSAHNYDFEFGGKGIQSPRDTYSVGLSYGWSFRLNDRFNLDLNGRVGYLSSKLTEYVPQCGEYVITSRKNFHYFGPTSLEVTLVFKI